MAIDTGIVVSGPVTKKPWQSKTVILNALLAILAAIAFFWPGATAISGWINGNGALLTSLWGLLGIVLRLITKDAISLED